MVRRLQETTRLMREATSAVINIKKIWCCVSAAWPIHDFTNKNSNILSLKVRKLDKEVIGVGCWERVPDFGTLVQDWKLLKICATRMRLIVAGGSGAIIMHLATC